MNDMRLSFYSKVKRLLQRRAPHIAGIHSAVSFSDEPLAASYCGKSLSQLAL